MTSSNLSTQKHWLVKANNIDGYFETISGGERSSDVSQNYDGGARVPELVAGPATTGNVTISRKFKRGRDDLLLKKLRPQVGFYRSTISKQATDGNGVTVGPPVTYPQALLVRMTEPEADSNGSDFSSFELEYAVSSAV